MCQFLATTAFIPPQTTTTQETNVLSPHEIAALILVKDAPNPEELDPVAIDMLLTHQFVTLEDRPSGQACPRLTPRGDSVLKAVGRFR
ncbi:hypothetical protein ACIP1U_24870 [Cupriavidus sp. NPDC089707]|uniref:hypothetical protein n=1 Tax=Cupriavidus sp. NPDC089707 TaxID=3363963 RepID=UPI003800A5DB